MTTIELIPHLDAGDRTRWTAVQNARPLSELGRRQAAALCDAISAAGVDALYSSPAVRCTQSLEPLAERFGLQITILPDLIEKMFGEDRAALAIRAHSALDQIRGAHPDARVAICSHGDLIPALVHHLTIEHGASPAEELTTRGQWYTIGFHPNAIGIALNEIGPLSS